MFSRYNIIAITHKTSALDQVGRFHLSDLEVDDRLKQLKTDLNLSELFYLSTCNRVEFHFVSTSTEKDIRAAFFKAFDASWSSKTIQEAVKNSVLYSGEEAILHLFRVASSLDSLVIGEREIITQVRNSYENCRKIGITGDFTRLLIKKTIETAKEVYTKTEIARKPVSVVSLAYHELKQLNVPLDARFLIIGSGKTNYSMTQFLKKHGYKKFDIFNRTLKNAQTLAKEIGGQAHELPALANYTKGFDVLISCTGSNEQMVTPEIYNSLLAEEKTKKVVIDLAIPNDVDTSIKNNHNLTLITVDYLKKVAAKNLKEREKELEKCQAIIIENFEKFKKINKERSVELAMQAVPQKVREIKEVAINQVFAREVNALDANSREVLDKIMAYIEKKYISVPMKLAKDILLEKSERL